VTTDLIDREIWRAEAANGPFPALDESALIAMVQAGSRDAFDELARRYAVLCFNQALRRLKAYPTVSDAHYTAGVARQIGFVKAFQRIDQYNSVKGAFLPWLLGIMDNVAKDLRDFDGRLAQLNNDGWLKLERVVPDPDPAVDPEREAIRKEIVPAVKRSMLKMQLKAYMALNFHLIEGMPLEEVADLMFVSVQTAKNYVQRGRLYLIDYRPTSPDRELLEVDGFEPPVEWGSGASHTKGGTWHDPLD
jgi:RNA polymerase sigma factor (sigma-70 family)